MQNEFQSLIVLRATKSDSRDVWEWRSDEITRHMSISTDNVSWATHRRWYEKSLINQNRYLYLGFLNGSEKIGMCRFDVDNSRNVAEVSINMNPMHRGKKLSSQLLSGSIVNFSKEKSIDLLATIKIENIGSIKCFTKNGFIIQREESGHGYYRKKINLSAPDLT